MKVMRSFVGSLALGAVLAAGTARGAGQEPPKPLAREGIEALEAQLDRAVDRVSLPHAGRLLGRAESARGYRLPGYGVVLVLTPRALPVGSGHVYFIGRGPRSRHGRVVTPPPGAPTAVVVESGDEGVEVFERQVLVLQHETEAARRAAEEEMERIVRDARVRVAPPAQPTPVAAPAPPVPATAPAPPAPEAPRSPAAPPPAAAPQALPPPPPAEAPLPPGEPGPPPWKFWFEAGAPAETRTPDAVIADVRASLVEALLAPGEAARGLAGDERVTVAVDFVPGGLFAANARPGRTLVVSVRARDVAARVKGTISVEELRRRVEVNEY